MTFLNQIEQIRSLMNENRKAFQMRDNDHASPLSRGVTMGRTRYVIGVNFGFRHRAGKCIMFENPTERILQACELWVKRHNQSTVAQQYTSNV